MLSLMPEWSVSRLVDAGAQGIKILLSWTPFDDPVPNEHKKVLIERIGAECATSNVPFFLEPVGWDPKGGLDVKGYDYAVIKPDIVIRTMEEFSHPRYRVDVLKVEFPVNSAFIGSAYTREQALDYYRRADAAANGIPY